MRISLRYDIEGVFPKYLLKKEGCRTACEVQNPRMAESICEKMLKDLVTLTVPGDRTLETGVQGWEGVFLLSTLPYQLNFEPC